MVVSDLGLGRIGQLGIIVRDIKTSVEHYWHPLGIGPWTVYTNGVPPSGASPTLAARRRTACGWLWPTPRRGSSN